jgi:hypothetical protein
MLKVHQQYPSARVGLDPSALGVRARAKAEDDSFTPHGQPAGGIKLPANPNHRINKKEKRIKNSGVMEYYSAGKPDKVKKYKEDVIAVHIYIQEHCMCSKS